MKQRLAEEQDYSILQEIGDMGGKWSRVWLLLSREVVVDDSNKEVAKNQVPYRLRTKSQKPHYAMTCRVVHQIKTMDVRLRTIGACRN